MIKITGLKHIYEDGNGEKMVALNGIDLEIPKGQFVAIIGANGCGKSTLARHLNALLLPTEGKVFISGMDTTDESKIWDIRQKAGMVFQNPDNQIVAAVVEEDVAFGPENIGVPSTEICHRVANALDLVGMTEYAKYAPHRLSGGQKQRVAIAGILALEPECLILDEPTAMLDPGGRDDVLRIVKTLNKKKKLTIVYITHFMSEAMEADRVIVMNKGKIVSDGTPSEIFSQVKFLQKLNLDAPLAAKVAFQLQKSCPQLSEKIITDNDLAEALCQ